MPSREASSFGTPDGARQALFCVTVYFGLRGARSAAAFRTAMSEEGPVSALEASLAAALAARPPGLEVSDVGALHIALLDDTAAETEAPAVQSRLAVVASLAEPPPAVARTGSRLLNLTRYFTARSHLPARASRASSSSQQTPRASRASVAAATPEAQPAAAEAAAPAAPPPAELWTAAQPAAAEAAAPAAPPPAELWTAPTPTRAEHLAAVDVDCCAEPDEGQPQQ